MITRGPYTISARVIAAPLSGCSDLAFRLICREHGAQFCFMEMIDAHSVIYHHPKTLRMLITSPQDSPIGIQLLGNDPALMVDAALRITETVPDFSILDINSACPVPKVTKKGAGAALLLQPKKLCAIIKALAAAIKIPITVKLRIGYEEIKEREILALTQECEQNGASALFVHGRLMTQFYSGEVNYEIIRQIKKAVTIPIIGSGNIFTAFAAERMYTATGCDGVLVARGAFGNPWLFKHIEHYMTHKEELPFPEFSYRQKVALRHLGYIHTQCRYSPKGIVGMMRKVAMWYLKGIPHAAHLRQKITQATDSGQLMQIVRKSDLSMMP